MRPSFYLGALLSLLLLSLGLCYAHYSHSIHEEVDRHSARMAAVAVMGVADLALNTAARYIRHVSLADTSTAFQDCPCCLDYFPGAFSANPPDFPGIQTVLKKAGHE